MANTMTILDFMKKMKEKVPSNMFTEYSIYAEVDPEFMVNFGDMSPIELAQLYGASIEEISEPSIKQMKYDGYGEFDEIDVQGDASNELAYAWLQKRYEERKLNSFWPIVQLTYDGNLAIVEPNGMIDNGNLMYDGMTLHEFMKALSQLMEDHDNSNCKIVLPNQNEYLIYNDAKVDTAINKVLLSFK